MLNRTLLYLLFPAVVYLASVLTNNVGFDEIRFPYTDEVFHLFGGLSIVVMLNGIFPGKTLKDLVFLSSSTMVVAVFWEFYEYFTLAEGLELGDTLCDLALGYLAAVIFCSINYILTISRNT